MVGRERLLQELQLLHTPLNNPMQLEQRWLQQCLAEETVNWHLVGEAITAAAIDSRNFLSLVHNQHGHTRLHFYHCPTGPPRCQ